MCIYLIASRWCISSAIAQYPSGCKPSVVMRTCMQWFGLCQSLPWASALHSVFGDSKAPLLTLVCSEGLFTLKGLLHYRQVLLPLLALFPMWFSLFCYQYLMSVQCTLNDDDTRLHSLLELRGCSCLVSTSLFATRNIQSNKVSIALGVPSN